MISKALFRSDSIEWETPQEFFDMCDREFHFTLDVCSTAENAKCKKYFTIEDNGLKQPWTGERVWMNPPYGKEISKWMKKAYEESKKRRFCCVFGSSANGHYMVSCVCVPKANVEIRFIKSRLKFGGCANNAPFPSMLVIYRGGVQ